jgi:hypothetical protein
MSTLKSSMERITKFEQQLNTKFKHLQIEYGQQKEKLDIVTQQFEKE